MNTMLNKNPRMRAPILGQTQRSKLVVYPAISHRISSFGCFSSIRKIAQLNQAQLEEVRGNPVLGSRLDAVQQNSLAIYSINIYIYIWLESYPQCHNLSNFLPISHVQSYSQFLLVQFPCSVVITSRFSADNIPILRPQVQ